MPSFEVGLHAVVSRCTDEMPAGDRVSLSGADDFAIEKMPPFDALIDQPRRLRTPHADDCRSPYVLLRLEVVVFDEDASGVLSIGVGYTIPNRKSCDPVAANDLERFESEAHVVTVAT